VPNFSSYSGIVSGTTQSDTQAPTAPSGLNPTVISSTQINLSWTASTDNVAVTGYRVERCQGSSCSNFAEVGTPSGTTFDDTTGLSPSTTYRYRVRAQDAVPNFSGYSGIVNATTQAPADSQAPTAPSGLMVIASSSTEIDLVWGASTDNVAVTAYLVERCQGPGCSNFTQVGSTPLTRFDDPNRTPATTYRYRVRAQDAVPNFSPYSNVISIVTPASSPDCD
jgi:chitodextrinase